MIVGSPSRLAALALVAAIAACGREHARQAPPPEPPPTAAQEVGRSPSELTPAAPPEPGQRASRQRRAAARASTVRRVVGTLERRSGDRVVIRGPGAERVTLAIDRGTAITLDGRAARVEALREGSEVRASYESGRGEHPAALSIEGRSAGGRAPASEAPSGEAAREGPGGK